jgi:hypothetical protein
MWVNLTQLVLQGLPDRSGSILPVGTTAVTYDLQDLTPGGHSLMANDLSVDSASGQAIPACPYCCPYSSEYFTPDPIEVIIDGFGVLGIDGVDSCNGNIYNITVDFTTWSSSNSSIAEVTKGQVQGVAVGNVTGSAQGLVLGPGECGCNLVFANPNVPINVISISQSPTILNMSSGDTGKGITVSVSPASIASSVTFAQGSTTNPNSSSTATFTYNKPTSFTGNDLWTISIGGTNSPSGIQNSQACTHGVCSTQLSNVVVPPQILIQMVQAEAGGTNATTMTAVAEVLRNRFASSIFNPPYSTYQNAIPGQFATSSTSNGIEPELDIAASVFTGNSAGTFCGSLAFWTPTSSQWNIVQNTLTSGTTTFPGGTGAPTYNSSKWPTSSQQILFVPAVGTNSSGVPYFLFLAQRGSTQAAAVNASCN